MKVIGECDKGDSSGVSKHNTNDIGESGGTEAEAGTGGCTNSQPVHSFHQRASFMPTADGQFKKQL